MRIVSQSVNRVVPGVSPDDARELWRHLSALDVLLGDTGLPLMVLLDDAAAVYGPGSIEFVKQLPIWDPDSQ